MPLDRISFTSSASSIKESMNNMFKRRDSVDSSMIIGGASTFPDNNDDLNLTSVIAPVNLGQKRIPAFLSFLAE
uniref:Uncharacterized protein n=1 Tax=Salix viminalis TaxID=40686 RepID=A0A6N2LLK2_SALVM